MCWAPAARDDMSEMSDEIDAFVLLRGTNPPGGRLVSDERCEIEPTVSSRSRALGV